MAFRFALAPLLRLRLGIERQRTLRLQQENSRFAQAEATLAQLDQVLAESAQSDSAALVSGRSAAELQFATVLREKLSAFRDELISDLRKRDMLRQKALGEYRVAYRDREILETLRLQQSHAYHQEQSRRQQQDLDATFLLQRWHHRNRS
jgi:flagellar biosynthesis chaperone FliJ